MTEQNLSDETTIKLTQYSRGAGCGCKIAPSVLHEILQNNYQQTDDNLIIGNNTNDDAAVYDIGNGKAIISTTDFFMPIVDDAVDFGKIASANAISDIYAMGGKPLMAIAVLGWPIEKLSPALAKKVIEGAREVCSLAGISLAGGHSIDSTEPIFGLAVTGIIDKENIKKNNTAQEGDFLFITKSIGVGILSTAQKRGLIQPNHTNDMIHQMSHLNNIGENLGKIAGVSAMTDVTGFGLLGHAIEMAEGAELTLELYYASIPVLSGAKEYLSQRIVPDATYRNWNSYSTKTSFEKGVNVMEAFNLLPDPQTNGGLLFSVKEFAVAEIVALMKETGYQDFIEPIGRFVKKTDKTIIVKNQ